MDRPYGGNYDHANMRVFLRFSCLVAARRDLTSAASGLHLLHNRPFVTIAPMTTLADLDEVSSLRPS